MKSIEHFLNNAFFVILRVPDLSMCKLLLPGHNYIGGQMLGRLFDAGLKEAGLLGSPSPALGPLNSSITFFDVNNWRDSVPIIKRVLEENQLTPYAYIYKWDQDELIYRLIFPLTGPSLNSHDFGQLIQAEQQLLKVISQLLSLQKPTSTEPPSQS